MQLVRFTRGSAGAPARAVLALSLAASLAGAAPGETPLHAGRIDPFAGLSLDQKVQLLADREEIRDLIATYAHRAAHRQSMADLFTDDGTFINRTDARSPPTEIRGRAALDRFFDGLGSLPQHPLPTVHNILISVEGDRARAMSSIEVHVVTSGKVADGSGYYRDVLRRENGRWKFVVRDCSFFLMQDHP